MSQTNNICVLCNREFHATYSERDKDWKHWKEVAEEAKVCAECQRPRYIGNQGGMRQEGDK